MEGHPNAEGMFWSKLKGNMEYLDVVNRGNMAVLCRHMYTEYGTPRTTCEDGHPIFNYHETTSTLWHRMKAPQVSIGAGHLGALQGWPCGLKQSEMEGVWCLLVCALQVLDEWPFLTRNTQYPDLIGERFCCSWMKKFRVAPSPYAWLQGRRGPRPRVSDLLTPYRLSDCAKPHASSVDGLRTGQRGHGTSLCCRTHMSLNIHATPHHLSMSN